MMMIASRYRPVNPRCGRDVAAGNRSAATSLAVITRVLTPMFVLCSYFTPYPKSALFRGSLPNIGSPADYRQGVQIVEPRDRSATSPYWILSSLDPVVRSRYRITLWHCVIEALRARKAHFLLPIRVLWSRDDNWGAAIRESASSGQRRRPLRQSRRSPPEPF
jgi:hypothetical protein